MAEDVIETIIKCFASSILLIDIFGIFGNINLIVVTLAFKQIRTSKCSLLIGLIAALDLVCTGFGIQAFVYDMTHKHDLLLYRNECFAKIWPFVFIACLETVYMLLLAIDRFVAVAKPVLYKQINSIMYFAIATAPGALFGTVIVVLGFAIDENDNLIQFCLPTTSLNLDAQWIYTLGITVINCCTVVVYVTVGFFIWSKSKSSGSSDLLFKQQIKITKTIAFIVFFFVLTWVAGHLISFVANVIFHGNMRRCLYHLLSMLPTHLNYAMNFYIYFWRNTTYRHLFKHQIRCAVSTIFCGRCCRPTTIAVLEATSTRVQRLSNSQK
uniref:G_PROTEIN_RECEP_F1_2 domain-containing protein n=1 Tax=Steinernema glaseri TaxID=37863 RepID=A0A1I8A8V6_9BILA